MNNADDLKKEFPFAMQNPYCGVYHPSGWNDIVREAVAVLERHKAKVSQTKQKFGGLRIYIEFDNDLDLVPEEAQKECKEAILRAEERASRTCEACGQPAEKLVKMSWYGPACEECKKKDKKGRQNS